MVSKEEIHILSYYRAGELNGAVLFGKLALVTDIDEIRIPLTRHCLEEAEHGWLWTKVIKDLGHIPIKIINTYQTEYGKEFGIPRNALEILCLTQILEKRVLSHFIKHLSMPNLNPIIKEALKKMIEDEQGHLNWIKKELDKFDKEESSKVMKKLSEIDQKVYERISSQSPFKEYFGEIL
ncbi:MAG: ferritin-like domain-containing protein [Candidatus Pacearchaeota archaeon]